MKRTLLQFLALLPLPIIVVFVVLAGRRAPEQQLVLDGQHDRGHSEAGDEAASSREAGVRLPGAVGEGWKLEGEVQRYDDETLFDRINGAAPAYLRAGFSYSLGGEYKREERADSVVVDIYDMGAPERALGMYATERDLSYTFVEVGDEGYLASGSLNFWRGRFYGKLAGFSEGEEIDRALIELANGLVQALPESPAEARRPLQQLALLPEEGRIPHSQGYSHPELADIAGLSEVFFADYRHGEEERLRLFVGRAADAGAAARRVSQFKAYFEEEGATIEEREIAGAMAVVAHGEQATSFAVARANLLLGAIDLVVDGMLEAAVVRWESALQQGDAPAKAP